MLSSSFNTNGEQILLQKEICIKDIENSNESNQDMNLHKNKQIGVCMVQFDVV